MKKLKVKYMTYTTLLLIKSLLLTKTRNDKVDCKARRSSTLIAL